MSSICQTCGLPNDICVCQEISKTGQKIKVSIEKRKYRKPYTIVEGFDEGADMHELAKTFKKKLACGGTSKGNKIELQGEHKDKVKQILLKMNYSEDQIDIV